MSNYSAFAFTIFFLLFSGFCLGCGEELMKLGSCPICRQTIQAFNQDTSNQEQVSDQREEGN